MPRNWGEAVRKMLSWAGVGPIALSGVGAPAIAAVPNGVSAEPHPLDSSTFHFERQNYNDGQQLFAAHRSHSSHASHASHSSHYSSAGSGYDSAPPPAPLPPPSYVAPAPAPVMAPPPPRATISKPKAADKFVMVMRVQSKLHELGYYAGLIDGKLGPGTIDALKRFQAVQGYASTGKMDNETLAALGIAY